MKRFNNTPVTSVLRAGSVGLLLLLAVVSGVSGKETRVVLKPSDSNAVDGEVWIDAKRVTGLHGLTMEPIDKMVPAGIIIDLQNGDLHQISIVKTDRAGKSVRGKPVMGRAQGEVLADIEIPGPPPSIITQPPPPMSNFTLESPKSTYRITIVSHFPATLMIDDEQPRAVLTPNQAEVWSFDDLRPHRIILKPNDREGDGIVKTVTRSDDGKVITFDLPTGRGSPEPARSLPVTSLDKWPWQIITLAAAGGLILFLLAYVLLKFHSTTRKLSDNMTLIWTQVAEAAAGKLPPEVLRAWPPFMTQTATHLIPVKSLKTGGMGTAWVVAHYDVQNLHQPPLQTVVKICHEQYCRDWNSQSRRFIDEAKIIKKLESTGVVPRVLDQSTRTPSPGVRLWYEMEYLNDWLLLRALIGGKARRSLPVDQSLAIIPALIGAISTIHSFEVVHRDLSPENVFLKQNNGTYDVKLIDFGSAKYQKRKENPENFVGEETVIHDHVGKLNYMSTEQCDHGLIAAGPSSDWYALGIIIWEMVTGHPPYGNREEHRQWVADLRPLIDRGIPLEIAQIIASMFHPNQEQRPTAKQINDAFHQNLAPVA